MSISETCSEENCDVLIIGGGPAGSTAAALLAEKGRDVVLLEKDRHPRFHIGESLLPQNLEIFERLGLLDEIARIGVHKAGAEFVSDEHDKEMIFDFSNALDQQYSYSFQVRRAEFDELLFSNAQRKGARTYENTRVMDVEFNSADRSVVTAVDAAGRQVEWRPRYVIDASGRDTFLATKYGTKEKNTRNTTAAIFGHFENVPRRAGKYEGNITIHLFDRGWFWMIPLPEGVMSVGVVGHADFFKTRKTDLESFFFQAVGMCPSVAQRMSAAKLVSPITATGNYSYQCSSMVGDGYLMIGDSFAFIDPVFSSGVMLAMAGATLGADVANAWLDDPRKAEPLIAEFDRKVRRALDTLSWLIYRINDPVLRDMFMQPRNTLKMRQGLTSLLAGNVHANTHRQLPVLAFKAAFYFLSVCYRFGYRLGPDGMRKMSRAAA